MDGMNDAASGARGPNNGLLCPRAPPPHQQVISCSTDLFITDYSVNIPPHQLTVSGDSLQLRRALVYVFSLVGLLCEFTKNIVAFISLTII